MSTLTSASCRRLLPEATGDVLEIGVGPGVNFPYYDPARVRKLYALEPNATMVRLSEQSLGQSKLNVGFIALSDEQPAEVLDWRRSPSRLTSCYRERIYP